MLGSGEILVMPCTPQVSHLYTHSPVWNANSKFCFLFSPDSLEKSKAWGKRNVDSLNLMPFNKSPIYTVSTWGKKWCMRAQNASPLDQEFVKFWILTFWKSFQFQKLFQYLISCIASCYHICTTFTIPIQLLTKEFVSAFYVSTLSTNEKSSHRAAAWRKWKNKFRTSVRGQGSRLQSNLCLHI